jgi:hypothetical protein
MTTVAIATTGIDEHVERTLSWKAEHIELLAAWRQWREAVRAHNVAKRDAGTPFHARPVVGADRLDAMGLSLPTFTASARAHYRWHDVAAEYRAAHPVAGAEGAAYVAKMGSAYEVKCPEHPRFRRIAWTAPRVPAESAHKHNREHHEGAPVTIMARTDMTPSSLLPTA